MPAKCAWTWYKNTKKKALLYFRELGKLGTNDAALEINLTNEEVTVHRGLRSSAKSVNDAIEHLAVQPSLT